MTFNKDLIIKKKYKLIKQLGKGTFSRVFKCADVSTHVSKLDNNNNKKKKKRKVYAVKVIRAVLKYQIASKTELEVFWRDSCFPG